MRVGIGHRRSAEDAMELLEETIATMQRGEPLLYRNRWNRETGLSERVESPCYRARVESMCQNTRYYPLFDADDNVIEGQYAFDESDLPMPLEEVHALWAAWFASRGF